MGETEVTTEVVPVIPAPILETNGATPPPEPLKEIVKEREPVADKFAALARKEKAVVRSRQELAAMKAQIEGMQKEMESERAEFKRWKSLKDNAKIDPDSYLNEAGLTTGYLNERLLKGGQDPNAIYEKTERRISEFEKMQQERDRKASEDQKTNAQKEWETKVANFVQGIHDFVDQNKETYELTAIHGQQNLIFEVIQEGAKREQVISVKDAAEKVESYLAEQVEKALAAKRFKDKYGPIKKEEVAPPKEPGNPTLNNSLSTTTPIAPNGYISEKERDARALAALNKALGES